MKDEIVAEVQKYTAAHGYAPTVSEITAALGLSTTSLAQYYIDQLVAEGRLIREPRKARTLRVP